MKSGIFISSISIDKRYWNSTNFLIEKLRIFLYYKDNDWWYLPLRLLCIWFFTYRKNFYFVITISIKLGKMWKLKSSCNSEIHDFLWELSILAYLHNFLNVYLALRKTYYHFSFFIHIAGNIYENEDEYKLITWSDL